MLERRTSAPPLVGDRGRRLALTVLRPCALLCFLPTGALAVSLCCLPSIAVASCHLCGCCCGCGRGCGRGRGRWWSQSSSWLLPPSAALRSPLTLLFYPRPSFPGFPLRSCVQVHGPSFLIGNQTRGPPVAPRRPSLPPSRPRPPLTTPSRPRPPLSLPAGLATKESSQGGSPSCLPPPRATPRLPQRSSPRLTLPAATSAPHCCPAAHAAPSAARLFPESSTPASSRPQLHPADPRRHVPPTTATGRPQRLPRRPTAMPIPEALCRPTYLRDGGRSRRHGAAEGQASAGRQKASVETSSRRTVPRRCNAAVGGCFFSSF